MTIRRTILLVALIPILSASLSANSWLVAPLRFPDVDWQETPETQRVAADVERLKADYRRTQDDYRAARKRYGKKSDEARAARQRMEAARKAYRDKDYELGWMHWGASMTATHIPQ